LNNWLVIFFGDELVMKEISCKDIVKVVSMLCIEANLYIPEDIENALEKSLLSEESAQGKSVIEDLLLNIDIARKRKIPACQDTGMAVVFVELGQEIHIKDGSLEEAIIQGVSKGYKEGYLRASVVSDPILRENTGDNTPPVIHYEIVPGDKLSITLAPKGFGSENMSAVKMFNPSDGIVKIKEFIVETVSKAGPNPCPPVIVGVGIGGTMEKAALLAKRALLRPVGENNPQKHISDLELEILEEINALGIGPGGLGGRITALAANIETYPTHIAGLPVAVNMGCHATRHATKIM